LTAWRSGPPAFSCSRAGAARPSDRGERQREYPDWPARPRRFRPYRGVAAIVGSRPVGSDRHSIMRGSGQGQAFGMPLAIRTGLSAIGGNSGGEDMKKIARTAFLAALAALLGSTAPAFAQTSLKFALDWKFEGPSAPYFVAIDNGYFKAEGLDVTIDSGPGSVAGIARVAAGTYPLGFFDINSLVRFRDQNPDKDVKAVMMIYDRPPFAIVSLKKNGIAKPKDLEGKVLGAPAPDGAFAQWGAFAKVNGIDASRVKIENVGFPVREPMLAQGKVHAITGFSFSSFFNLRANKIAPEDIVVMLMADHGLMLYGNAIMVNPEFAAKNPKVVSGFVRAVTKGFIATARDPEKAIKSVMKRNAIGDEALELERLKMALRDNMITDWVKANGVGGIDVARMDKSIAQIGDSYEFKGEPPKASDIFTDSFLPPAAERKL